MFLWFNPILKSRKILILFEIICYKLELYLVQCLNSFVRDKKNKKKKKHHSLIMFEKIIYGVAPSAPYNRNLTVCIGK